MKPLPFLIAHWQRRERECVEEIDRLVEHYNAAADDYIPLADLKRMCATWEDERRIARDTVAWLRFALIRTQAIVRP